MRRKIDKGPYITRIFRFFWHKCEICQDEFRFEKGYSWYYGVIKKYFCSKHNQVDIKSWIKNFGESKAIRPNPPGYNPPPQNAKRPERPTPAPPKCE